jgi:hypothetical protein
MELIEVKSLIWAQKGKLYIIYENVFSYQSMKRIGLLKVGFLLGFSGWKLQTQR